MPIFVDHDERRVQIVTAALQVLGEQGFAKFTLKAVGAQMGGSVTLVTHYFPTRDELLDAVLEWVLAEARATQEDLLGITDPHERLEAVVRYFLPMTDDSLMIERARVAVASHRKSEPLIADHTERIDPVMREVVRRGVEDFVPPERLEATIDLIRLWTAGVVLTTIEHPEAWTPERQIEALQQFVALIDLPVDVS